MILSGVVVLSQLTRRDHLNGYSAAAYITGMFFAGFMAAIGIIITIKASGAAMLLWAIAKLGITEIMMSNVLLIYTIIGCAYFASNTVDGLCTDAPRVKSAKFTFHGFGGSAG